MIINDNIFSILITIFGIIYTFFAGKGKFLCFLSGIISTVLYAILAYKNGFFGNSMLYFFYYLPMMIIGIFNWKKNSINNEVIKIKLENNKRIIYFSIAILITIAFAVVLYYTGDKSPAIDSFITIFSILAMYFTVIRALEQWVVWFMVDIAAFYMWLQCPDCIALALSRLLYTILAIYFYLEWRKQLR